MDVILLLCIYTIQWRTTGGLVYMGVITPILKNFLNGVHVAIFRTAEEVPLSPSIFL